MGDDIPLLKSVCGRDRVNVDLDLLHELPEPEADCRDDLSIAAEYLGDLFAWLMGVDGTSLEDIGLRTLVAVRKVRPDLCEMTFGEMGRMDEKNVTPQAVRKLCRQFEKQLNWKDKRD